MDRERISKALPLSMVGITSFRKLARRSELSTFTTWVVTSDSMFNRFLIRHQHPSNIFVDGSFDQAPVFIEDA